MSKISTPTDAARTRLMIRQIRDRLLSTGDSVCLERARLYTEAYRRHEREPVPIRRALSFAHVLRNMTLDVETNCFFAGNTSTRPRAWMLLPEYGMNIGADSQIVVEHEFTRGFLDGKVPRDLIEFWRERGLGGMSHVGHLAVNLNTVVREGLKSVLDRIKRHESEGGGKKEIYRRAMHIAVEAVIEWADRYASAAEEAAYAASDPLLREAHLRVARACRNVPANPARNLFEGLQAIILVHLALCIEGHGMSVSIGLPDRALAHLINAEFDEEEATNLIAAFMLKINANSFLGRVSKTQAITIGGVDHRGRDMCNELTMCFLNACDLLRVGDPHLFLRWHPSINREVKARATELLSEGLSMPLLINDEPTARGFIEAGVAPEDAYDYCVIGCNELGVPGRCADSALCRSGLIQYLSLLNRVLMQRDGESVAGMSELLGRMERLMRVELSESRRRGEQRRERMANLAPMPFTSALMDGCIERGEDFLVGMKYRFPAHYERGLTNAVNALSAIDNFVFRSRELTMGQLIQALRTNLKDERLRSRLRAAPKWGNGDDDADRWALELLELRERVLDEIDRMFAHAPHFVCHVVRSLHHVDGKKICASPDGRRAGEPVADSIGAETGTALNGPTGVLNSVLKIDAPRFYRGGYNLNITLPGRRVPAGIVAALIETFFTRGGQELQINCLSAETLREAREKPELYGDLMVRVAGFSARFIDLSPTEQEELIKRAEAAEMG